MIKAVVYARFSSDNQRVSQPRISRNINSSFFVYGGDILKDIKTKEIKKKDIKVFDRATAWKERIKDPVVYIR